MSILTLAPPRLRMKRGLITGRPVEPKWMKPYRLRKNSAEREDSDIFCLVSSERFVPVCNFLMLARSLFRSVTGLVRYFATALRTSLTLRLLPSLKKLDLGGDGVSLPAPLTALGAYQSHHGTKGDYEGEANSHICNNSCHGITICRACQFVKFPIGRSWTR